MIERLSPLLFSFAWFRCWAPVPQLCTETLYQEVESLPDVCLNRMLQDESFVCPKKEKDVHQYYLIRPIILPLEVNVRWEQPENSGGCSVTSYAIYTDMGVDGAGFTTQLEKATIENRPYLFEYTFVFTSAETGKTLGFELEATNERGATRSAQYLSVLLATAPGKPSGLIEVIKTANDSIDVQIPQILDTGGITILSLELAMDNGLQGDFTTVYSGAERRHEIFEGIE